MPQADLSPGARVVRQRANIYMSAMTTPCPICGKPESAAVRPFCSKRCADVDLNRWLSGVYAVPVADEEKTSPTLQPGEKHDDEAE